MSAMQTFSLCHWFMIPHHDRKMYGRIVPHCFCQLEKWMNYFRTIANTFVWNLDRKQTFITNAPQIKLFFHCIWTTSACITVHLHQRRLCCLSSIWPCAFLYCPRHDKCLTFCVVVLPKESYKVCCVAIEPSKHHQVHLSWIAQTAPRMRWLHLQSAIIYLVTSVLLRLCIMHWVRRKKYDFPINVSRHKSIHWFSYVHCGHSNDIHDLKWLKCWKYWHFYLRISFIARI